MLNAFDRLPGLTLPVGALQLYTLPFFTVTWALVALPPSD